MKLSINIQDEYLDFFLDLMNHLTFVKIENVQDFELSEK